ncbi:MAG: TolC family protein [Candidatus Omnitrophica bacterium]|nr:TolC family protein [Candidatus Omnitrophota bacterium]
MHLTRFFILIGFCLGLPLVSLAQEQKAPLRLTLAEALNKVDTVNLQVMMASARLEQAITRISQAQSDLLPHFDGVVSGGRQTVDLRAEGIQFPGLGTHIGPYNTFDARLRVTIALFDPSAFERFQAAKKGESLSEAQLEKTREDILALVATLFVDAQRKQQTFRLLQTLLEKDQKAYELSEDALAQGTGTLLDTNKLNSQLEQTKFLYQQAKLQAEDARLDLSAALQLPVNMPLLFLDDKDLLKALGSNAVINFNNTTNADMAMASALLEARKADQKIAYADFLPKVSGTADYGRSGGSPGHGSNTYFAGLQATVPLWEGGSQQSNVKEVKQKIKEAQENFLDASQQEQVNTAKAIAAIAEADYLIEAKIQNRQTAQRSLLIAFQAQKTGSGTVLEVMREKADLAIAEDQYNEAQALWVMSHIDLLHAQGRLRMLVSRRGK